MYDIVGQVLGVVGSNTRNNRLMFSVQFSDGNVYTTFDNGLAGRCQQLVGQQVSARVEQKPKRDGDGFWLNILDIAPAGQLAQAAQPTVPGTTFQPGTPVQQAAPQGFVPQQQAAPQGLPPGVEMKPDYQRDLSPEAQKRVGFHAAAHTAATLVAGIFNGAGVEGMEEAEAAFKRITVETYIAAQGGSAKATAAATTPEAIAAAVPGVEVGAPEPEEPEAPADVPSW